MERIIYEEHHDMYSQDSILVIKLRIMTCGENKAHMEKRNAYRVLVEKHEGKSPLGRPRHR